MGGIPAAISGGLSTAGAALGGAAKSFWGAGKEALNENYVQPWKNAVSDVKGNPPADPTTAPGQSETNPAMQAFFNAPQAETPAMRLRRMQQQ